MAEVFQYRSHGREKKGASIVRDGAVQERHARAMMLPDKARHV
jgi:hypothetical protein